MEQILPIQPKQGLKEIFRSYRKTAAKPVDMRTFRRVWQTFIREVVESIVLGGRDFNMPSLGSLGIRKQKVIVKMTPEGDIDKRSLRPDWDATKKLWAKDAEAKDSKQLVYHLNKHFNGFNVKWWWDKSTCSVINNTAYTFALSRANKRFLAGVINNEDIDVDYYEVKPKSYERKT